LFYAFINELLLGNVKLAYIKSREIIALFTRVMKLAINVVMASKKTWSFTPITYAFNIEHYFPLFKQLGLYSCYAW
jgi:hypothetical protein